MGQGWSNTMVAGDLRRLRRGVLAAVMLAATPVAVVGLSATSAAADSTYTVDDNGDPGVGNPANCPAVPAGTCTMRDAFAAASANGQDDIIVITAGLATIALANGRLHHNPATGSLTIQGNGNTIQQTVVTDEVIRSTRSLSIDHLTTIGGAGGVFAGATGAMTLTSSSVTGVDAAGVVAGRNTVVTNSVVSAANGSGVIGGGAGTGTATVTGSTVTGNTGVLAANDVEVVNSTVTGTGSEGVKGAASNPPSGNARVTSSTVTGTVGVIALNVTVVNSTVSNACGGVSALFNTTLVYATVVQNVTSGSCGPNVRTGTLASFGSVVALPQTGANCTIDDATTSSGYNVSDDASCGFTGPGDRQNAGSPVLGALAANGGPTQTRLPQTGSPLVDAIPNSSCGGGDALAGSAITTDQRAFARPSPSGGSCDVGAVEVQTNAVVTNAVDLQPRFTG